MLSWAKVDGALTHSVDLSDVAIRRMGHRGRCNEFGKVHHAPVLGFCYLLAEHRQLSPDSTPPLLLFRPGETLSTPRSPSRTPSIVFILVFMC